MGSRDPGFSVSYFLLIIQKEVPRIKKNTQNTPKNTKTKLFMRFVTRYKLKFSGTKLNINQDNNKIDLLMSASDNILQYSGSNSLFFLQNALKSNLLAKLQSGNQLVDALVGILIISSQETLIGYIGSIKRILMRSPSSFFGILKFLLKVVRGRKKFILSSTHKKTATVKYITDGKEINTIYEPVMWYLSTLTETKKEREVHFETTKNNPDTREYVPQERSTKIRFLDHKIVYEIRKENIRIYADKEYTRENFIITFTTETPKNREKDIFTEFFDTCQKKHSEFKKKEKWQQQIFRNTGNTWSSKPTKNARKIDTVILKEGQKEELVSDLDDFLNEEEWYTARDVPYKRGYLFYGKPGCGKSSLIRAIASHSKRHIHYLILSEIKSDSELFSALESVNFAETVLVIEDIDCASPVTKSRDSDKESEKTQEDSDKEEDKKDDEGSKKEKSTLTLSGLLNAIDGGVIDTHGQILICTTNHHEALDEALIRCGRIDKKVEFGLVDYYQVRGLFMNFFSMEPPTTFEVAKNMHSPAKVTSILLDNKKDPVAAWYALQKQIS